MHEMAEIEITREIKKCKLHLCSYYESLR